MAAHEERGMPAVRLDVGIDLVLEGGPALDERTHALGARGGILVRVVPSRELRDRGALQKGAAQLVALGAHALVVRGIAAVVAAVVLLGAAPAGHRVGAPAAHAVLNAHGAQIARKVVPQPREIAPEREIARGAAGREHIDIGVGEVSRHQRTHHGGETWQVVLVERVIKAVHLVVGEAVGALLAIGFGAGRAMGRRRALGGFRLVGRRVELQPLARFAVDRAREPEGAAQHAVVGGRDLVLERGERHLELGGAGLLVDLAQDERVVDVPAGLLATDEARRAQPLKVVGAHRAAGHEQVKARTGVVAHAPDHETEHAGGNRGWQRSVDAFLREHGKVRQTGSGAPKKDVLVEGLAGGDLVGVDGPRVGLAGKERTVRPSKARKLGTLDLELRGGLGVELAGRIGSGLGLRMSIGGFVGLGIGVLAEPSFWLAGELSIETLIRPIAGLSFGLSIESVAGPGFGLGLELLAGLGISLDSGLVRGRDRHLA